VLALRREKNNIIEVDLIMKMSNKTCFYLSFS